MAQPAVARPTLALDPTIEFRFDQASAVRTRRHGPKPLLECQPWFQSDGLGSREAVKPRVSWLTILPGMVGCPAHEGGQQDGHGDGSGMGRKNKPVTRLSRLRCGSN
jgi:hypothetical protein